MEYLQTGLVFWQKGGAIMYVLLFCSLAVVAIGIERGLYFSRMDAGRTFAFSFLEAMEARDFEKACRLAKSARGILPQLILSAGKVAENRLTSYLEIQVGAALSKLRAHIYYLSVIVTMAPLLGLLGTISGMISAFSVFNLESGQAAAITGGVGEALIATAMGLCVAILSLAVHAYFSQRIEAIVTDMEQCLSMVEAEKDAWRQAAEQEAQP